jgi:hypothetical protein
MSIICQSFKFLRAPFSSFLQYVASDGPSNSTKAFQVGDVAALGAATERVQTSSSGENHVSTETNFLKRRRMLQFLMLWRSHEQTTPQHTYYMCGLQSAKHIIT